LYFFVTGICSVSGWDWPISSHGSEF
jgi:hypothetical protein